jgi:hypothetical protein
MRVAGLRRQGSQPIGETRETVHRGGKGGTVGALGVPLLPAGTQANLGTEQHAFDIER